MFRNLCIFGLLLVSSPCFGEDPIRTLAEVQALSDERALTALPVRVEAVVLYAAPARGDMIIHDGTAACYSYVPSVIWSQNNSPRTGDRCEFVATTASTGITPNLNLHSFTPLRRGEIPAPRLLLADEIFSSRMDAAWVEVPAVVLGVESGGLAFTLTVEVYGKTFKADVPHSPDAITRTAALIQRPARMRAILGSVYNSQQQLVGRHFFVPSFDDIMPIAPVVNVNDVPLLLVNQLLTRNFSPTDLVRVDGVVTQVDAGGFYLRDKSGSARVLSVMSEKLKPGYQVSVQGYGAIAQYRPMLRATKVEILAEVTLPPPIPMDFSFSRDNSMMQMELVSVEADFLNSRHIHDEWILQCRATETVFEVILPDGVAPMPQLVSGDRLKLTGICELTTTHPLPRIEWINGFRIRLADSSAIVVLSHAPWWTTGRLIAALGVMTGMTVLGFWGTWFFGRAVRKQARVIGEKLSDEAVNDERDRMARDLHDTLEQQLAGVALQLDGLDKMAKIDASQISARLGLARRMLRHTRVEARRSVWDLRSKVLEVQGLGAALRSMAVGASSEEGPQILLEIAELGRPLPAGADFHLLRIAQEALANAIKHAAAWEVHISLGETADSVVLTIRDDGRGFPVAALEVQNTTHFGILGMQERVGKMGANLDIQSSPSHGCTISVTLLNSSTL